MRSTKSITRKTDTTCGRVSSAIIGVFALSFIAYASASFYRSESAPSRPIQTAENGGVRFADARRQSGEFIAYDRSLVLTPEQRTIMDEALSSIAAPCCKEFSIATCCCPCNLAKSTWGLSKLLITQHHASAPQVNAAVREWLHFTNAGGYSGDACFTEGCKRPFERNGCGGMDGAHEQ
jgi:hypothetical protein